MMIILETFAHSQEAHYNIILAAIFCLKVAITKRMT